MGTERPDRPYEVFCLDEAGSIETVCIRIGDLATDDFYNADMTDLIPASDSVCELFVSNDVAKRLVQKLPLIREGSSSTSENNISISLVANTGHYTLQLPTS